MIHSPQREMFPYIKNNDSIIFVRSAFLGDLAVCFPFIEFVIKEYEIPRENIYFLIMNNEGVNPCETIFGKNDILANNTFVINSSSIEAFYASINKLKDQKLSINHVIYLPTLGDSWKGKIQKHLMLKYIFGVFKKIHGFKSINQVVSESQYISLFNYFGFEFNFNGFNLIKEVTNDRVERETKSFVIAIYCNSKLPMKIWPSEKYIATLKELIKLYKDDRDYNQAIIDKLESNVNLENLAGKLSVMETYALFKEIDLFIGNDGFPLHIAGLANTPIVSIFSYKNPLGWWDPVISDKMITIRADVSCKLCYLSTCDNPVCVKEVSVESVIEAIETIIKVKNKVFREIRVLSSTKTLNNKYEA